MTNNVFEKYGGQKAKNAVIEVLANIDRNQAAMGQLKDCLKNYSRLYFEFEAIVDKAKASKNGTYGIWTLPYLEKTLIEAQTSAANGIIGDIVLCYNKMEQVIEKGDT